MTPKNEQKVGMLLQKRTDTRGVGLSSMMKSIYLLTTTPTSHTHRFHPLFKAVSIGAATKRNLQGYWFGNHVFFECEECYWSAFFLSRYVPRNLCTESAVPEEATRQGKVPGQESNGECSL